jgi:DNA-binding PadR family transcriptional regulator
VSARSASNELLLLGLLQRQAMHGYELYEFLEHRLHSVADLKKPTAYRLLERLHAEGLVDRAVERAGRRPERMVYRLTRSGLERFESLLREQLAQGQPALYPGNIPLLFSDHLPAPERGRLLGERRRMLREHRAGVEAAVAAHTSGTSPRLVLEHDLALLDAELQWLDQVLADEAEGAPPV